VKDLRSGAETTNVDAVRARDVGDVSALFVPVRNFPLTWADRPAWT
jgi:hypothetical protein